MKIAAIVITFNDGYKFKEWVDYHQIYKDELYMHIIVDNGSDPEYLSMVETAFSNSKIIKRTTNGGCTSAYNDGIKLALSDQNIDAIMLIANDIKLEKGSISNLFNFLFSDKQYGMVSPILLAKNSELIDDFGCEITKNLYMKPFDIGKSYNDLIIKNRVVKAVTGGMNMAKREFYEIVGLQDEKLFMYSDEVDMAIRAERTGFKMAVTSEIKSWHQHINLKGNIRSYKANFLLNRNKVYLANKHFGFMKASQIFIFQILRGLAGFKRGVNTNEILIFLNSIKGNILGYLGIMKNPNTRV